MFTFTHFQIPPLKHWQISHILISCLLVCLGNVNRSSCLEFVTSYKFGYCASAFVSFVMLLGFKCKNCYQSLKNKHPQPLKNSFKFCFRLNTIMESSASMLSDISYDKTEDDLDDSRLRSGRKWKRPTAPPLEDMDHPGGNTPPKRHKQVSQLVG